MRARLLSCIKIIFEEHGDAGRFDGDAAVLLILAGVGKASLSCVLCCDDTSLTYKRVRECGLPVVHVRNHGHVPDIVFPVHDFTQLLYCEVHLRKSNMTKVRALDKELCPKNLTEQLTQHKIHQAWFAEGAEEQSFKKRRLDP